MKIGDSASQTFDAQSILYFGLGCDVDYHHSTCAGKMDTVTCTVSLRSKDLTKVGLTLGL